jgi:toxin HigB-1
MIRSFRSKETENLFKLESSKRWANIERAALRKLVQLDLALSLSDLKVPPGNHLEALKDDRKGQWSVRINQQFRICFLWTDDGPREVEIVDYH